jgi:hypothetical protein
MTIPSLGRGGLSVYSPTSSTATATNGLRTVSFTGTALSSINSTTGATEYAVGVGDLFVVQGVGSKPIESVDSATQITLTEPWSAATQTGVANWYIIRNSVPAYGATAKAIQDVLAIGGDTSPNTSYTVDDGTARIKLRSNSGNPQLAVGATGAADGALNGAIQITQAGAAPGNPAGAVQFPFGVKEYVVGFRNPVINGDFSVWQMGTTVAPGFSAYWADQWSASYSTPAPTISQVAAPAGFRGQKAAQITVTGAAAGTLLDLVQRFKGRQLQDIDSQAATLSFDLNATTTAGTLSGSLILKANTALDNGTFSSTLANVGFTIPVGSGKVVVPLTTAQTAGLKNGAALDIRLAQAGGTGNWTVYLGSVQLEKGVVANDFEYLPLALVSTLCKRFYRRDSLSLRGTFNSGVTFECNVQFDMEATPTAALVTAGTRNNANPSVFPTSATGARFSITTTGVGDAFALGDVWEFNSRL